MRSIDFELGDRVPVKESCLVLLFRWPSNVPQLVVVRLGRFARQNGYPINDRICLWAAATADVFPGPAKLALAGRTDQEVQLDVPRLFCVSRFVREAGTYY
jgi:hypothetical protein